MIFIFIKLQKLFRLCLLISVESYLASSLYSCNFIPYILFAFFSNRQRLNNALIKNYPEIVHNRFPEGYQEAPLAYDAVWSVALAFNKTMERLKVKSRSLKDFTYTDKEIADEIYAAMNSTQFLGVSVSNSFFFTGGKLMFCAITINFPNVGI